METIYRGSENIENEARRLELMAMIANEETERILSKIKQEGFNPKKIVDYGCGTGDAFAVLEKLFPNAAIMGVDQSEKALGLAKSRYPKIELSQSDLENSLSLDQVGKINLAYLRNILLHLKNPQETLNEVKNCIEEGGILFVQEPDWSSAEANWDDFYLFKEAFTAMMQSMGINPYIGPKLQQMFEDIGIQDSNIDISNRKVTPKDLTWDILDYLIEVGGQRLNPYLREKGIADIQEMRRRIESAKKIPGAYFKTPSWVITWAKI